MGVMNQFQAANRRLQDELGYHLNPEVSDEFRRLLHKIGFKRFEQAVELIKRRGIANPNLRHRQLLTAMSGLAPRKRPGTGHRNRDYERGELINAEMDANYALAMALDKDPLEL
jgi:hypothetical protein